ncbi:hypothetical protein HK097_005986, partial [Rhizophlyctis rosea]
MNSQQRASTLSRPPSPQPPTYYAAPLRRFLSTAVRKRPIITFAISYGIAIWVVLIWICLPITQPDPIPQDLTHVEIKWWRFCVFFMLPYLVSTASLIVILYHSLTPWLLPTGFVDILGMLVLGVTPALALCYSVKYMPHGESMGSSKLLPVGVVLVALVPDTVEWMRRNVKMVRREGSVPNTLDRQGTGSLEWG